MHDNNDNPNRQVSFDPTLYASFYNDHCEENCFNEFDNAEENTHNEHMQNHFLTLKIIFLINAPMSHKATSKITSSPAQLLDELKCFLLSFESYCIIPAIVLLLAIPESSYWSAQAQPADNFAASNFSKFSYYKNVMLKKNNKENIRPVAFRSTSIAPRDLKIHWKYWLIQVLVGVSYCIRSHQKTLKFKFEKNHYGIWKYQHICTLFQKAPAIHVVLY